MPHLDLKGPYSGELARTVNIASQELAQFFLGHQMPSLYLRKRWGSERLGIMTQLVQIKDCQAEAIILTNTNSASFYQAVLEIWSQDPNTVWPEGTKIIP